MIGDARPERLCFAWRSPEHCAVLGERSWAGSPLTRRPCPAMFPARLASFRPLCFRLILHRTGWASGSTASGSHVQQAANESDKR